MSFAGLLYLILTHYLIGNGILRYFKVQQSDLANVCLSFMIGVPLMSFVPCFLQLMHIPLAKMNVATGIGVFAVLCYVPAIIYSKPRLITLPKFSLPKLYEWPFLLILLALVIISLWRCFYMPPYSRDMLSGPELVAEYAVREKTFINSVFKIDLSTSNNYFKSFYITALQVAYKLLVFPFGALWLSVLFVSFTTWLFSLVRQRQHPWIAGILMLLYFAVPELFAYTFVILYDYSNMVFFFSGFWFLTRYILDKRTSDFAFSAFLFGLATFIRTESLILIAMLAPMLVYNQYKDKVPIKKILLQLAVFGIVPFLFYNLCINGFVRNFVPIKLNLGKEINTNLSDISGLTDRLRDIVSVLIFSDAGQTYYGLYFHIFLAILVTDLIFFRRFSKEARMALYGVGVIYFGLGFIGYLLPLADLSNTTKRGLFKAVPIILMYLINSGFISRISDAIRKWEVPGLAAPVAAERQRPKPVAQSPAASTTSAVGKKSKKK